MLSVCYLLSNNQNIDLWYNQNDPIGKQKGVGYSQQIITS